MTVYHIRENGRSICDRLKAFAKRVSSDGEGGPDDGINHLHPEHAFHIDTHSKGAMGLHLFH